jgi:hypothetical protein
MADDEHQVRAWLAQQQAEGHRKRLETRGIGLLPNGDLDIVWPPLNPMLQMEILPPEGSDDLDDISDLHAYDRWFTRR